MTAYGGPDEGTDVVRYPAIAVRETTEVRVTIDLSRQPTGADPLKLGEVAADWTQIAVGVSLSSPQLAFAPGEHEGTIVIRRNADSVKCHLVARRTAPGPIEITAHFTRDGRTCGTARHVGTGEPTTRTTADTGCYGGVGPNAVHDDARRDPGNPPNDVGSSASARRDFGGPDSATDVHPVAPVADPAPRDVPAGETSGAFALPWNAVAPDLTVYIHRTESDRRRLVWTFACAPAHRAFVPSVCAESTLDEEPAAFVAALFALAVDAPPGGHVETMNGIGERLWDRTPREFKDAYLAMRGKLGTGFTIQLMTDEPHIPWELMRPVIEGEATQILGVTHPIARGLQRYPDRLRPTLPGRGRFVAVAPDYAGSELRPLPAARDEVALLCRRFGAIAGPATARRFIEVFQDPDRNPVRLLHFAGHAKADPQADRSKVFCEDEAVPIAKLRNAENRIGERYATFVVLNACDAGVAGDVGGWGEAFAYRKFSGFIAPLWAVFDGPAARAAEALFAALLEQKTTVGAALRDVRAAHGRESATGLSYVYYGDVNARFE